MATNTQARLTYQDYLDLPESDERYELIDGELYMAPPPIPEHQGFLGELTCDAAYLCERKQAWKSVLRAYWGGSLG